MATNLQKYYPPPKKLKWVFRLPGHGICLKKKAEDYGFTFKAIQNSQWLVFDVLTTGEGYDVIYSGVPKISPFISHNGTFAVKSQYKRNILQKLKIIITFEDFWHIKLEFPHTVHPLEHVFVLLQSHCWWHYDLKKKF